MGKIILIRHGETDYTKQEKCCGQKDVPLNTDGIRQARIMQLYFNSMKIDAVYSSDLKRAVQTAKIVFESNVIYKRKSLREIDFGKFYGSTYAEISKLYPEAYKMFLNNPKDLTIPGGENISKFSSRVVSCFNKIQEKSAGKTTALVGHINTIRVILLSILKQGLEAYWSIHQDVAAINIIEFKKGNARVLKINDTSYLKKSHVAIAQN